ncbi:MAG TPA: ATP synthase F1 subunit delta [Flavobacteriaceae bacterium]|nr:ATP synthase F1 subunit delta [Flavobacteriaceae bacterium]
MAGNRAAHRYAKALMSLAVENKQVEEIQADMHLIYDTIKDAKDLQNFLKSPIVKQEIKRSGIKAVFDSVNSTTTKLFDVLIDNNRIELLPAVSQAFIALVDRANNVITAEVTTATPLTPEVEKKVLDKVKELTGSDASLVQKVDSELLGGFLLRVGDLQYDASIAGRLNSLKQNFKQNIYN